MIAIELQHKSTVSRDFCVRVVSSGQTYHVQLCGMCGQTARRGEQRCVICLAENKEQHCVCRAEPLSRAPRPIGHLTPPHLCPNAVLFGDVPKLVTCGSHALQFCQLHS